MENADVLVEGRVGVQEPARAVGGPVVNADDLVAAEGLVDEGVQAVCHALFYVVEGDDDGDEGALSRTNLR